jgi:hypothetical protein
MSGGREERRERGERRGKDEGGVREGEREMLMLMAR